METLSIFSDDEYLHEKTVATIPSKDEYEGLDVFGTEAFDSVCGVDILEPFYGPDVKRVISLWSTLLLAATSVLTLGFFGCFHRLKGANLDLSRNLWNEDLFWTSLIIFLLTCLAITCGLSALASHTNLYSHEKVLGFRRVFRWCFALHAAAAMFTLTVALKLTLLDLPEPERSIRLTTTIKPSETAEGSRRLKRPHLHVYRGAFPSHSPAGPDPLSLFLQTSSVNTGALRGAFPSQSSAGPCPSFSMDSSFLQTSSVNTEAPASAESTGTTETGRRDQPAIETIGSIPSGEVPMKHAAEQKDIFRRESKGRESLVDSVLEAQVKSCRHQQKATWKSAFTGVQYPETGRYTTALLRINSSNGAKKQGFFPAARFSPKSGTEENFYNARMSPSSNSRAHASNSSYLNRTKSSTFIALETSGSFSQRDGDTGEPSLSRPAAGLNISPISPNLVSWQRSHPATLFPRQDAPKREAHRGAQAKSTFDSMKSSECFLANNKQKGGTGYPPTLQATAVPTTDSREHRSREKHSLWSRSDYDSPQVAALFFLEGFNREVRNAADATAVPEMKTELGPVRESQNHRIMLYLVMALDYAVAVLQVVCLIYTWSLAAKIGALYGLKIVKIPF